MFKTILNTSLSSSRLLNKAIKQLARSKPNPKQQSKTNHKQYSKTKQPQFHSIQQLTDNHYNYFQNMALENADTVKYCKIGPNILLIGYPDQQLKPELNEPHQHENYDQDQQEMYNLAQIIKIDEFVDDMVDSVDFQFFQIEPSQYLYTRRQITKQIIRSETFKNQEVGSIDALERSVIEPLQPDELKLDLSLLIKWFIDSKPKNDQNEENDLVDIELIDKLISNKGVLDQYDLIKGSLMHQIVYFFQECKEENSELYFIEPPELFTRLMLSNMFSCEQVKEILIDNLRVLRECKSENNIEIQPGMMQNLTMNGMGIKYFKTKDMIIVTIIENIITTYQLQQSQLFQKQLKELEGQDLDQKQFQLKKNDLEDQFFGQNKNMVFHLKMSHFYSLQQILELRVQQNQNQQLVDSLEWDDVFKLQRNPFNETEEQLIEKQVIMDFLFESEVWNQIYVKDPFLYLETDSINEEDKVFLAKTFYQLHQRYQKIIDQAIQQ